MDIQQLISFDQQLLLQINGSDSLFWDGFMWIATNMRTWIPMAIVLLYVIFKNNKIKETLLIIGLIALVFTLSDQISSGLCKPFFARFRPTQDPELMYQIDIVNGYRGGIYGFTSSHAANTFGLAIFLSLVIKNWSLSIFLFIWAAINAYSRMYLGVHYPGDILFGTLTGLGVGILVPCSSSSSPSSSLSLPFTPHHRKTHSLGTNRMFSCSSKSDNSPLLLQCSVPLQ